MEVGIYDIKGKKTKKTVTLPDNLVSCEINSHAMYLDVKLILANKRQGTAKTKERGEVVGSTRKIKKQKGTGTARAGSIKSPVFVGGGTIFGPKPRSYSFKLNKKLRKIARLSALSLKLRDKKFMVVEKISMDSPKTKDFLSILSNYSLDGSKKILVLQKKVDSSVYLSARNLPKVSVMGYNGLNTYNLLNSDFMLLDVEMLEYVKEYFLD